MKNQVSPETLVKKTNLAFCLSNNFETWIFFFYIQVREWITKAKDSAHAFFLFIFFVKDTTAPHCFLFWFCFLCHCMNLNNFLNNQTEQNTDA